MRGGGERLGLVSRYTALVIMALVVVSGVVAYYTLNQPGAPASTSSSVTGQAVPDAVLAELANVSPSTLNQVGSGASGVTSPKPVDSSAPLLVNGKPEVLYIGAEYCPFCAAERWSMIVALDKFGSFTGVGYSQSSATDVFPNTPTFTFRNATYSSNYIGFVSVEQTDRNHNRLQNVTADQTALVNVYDAAGSIPFIDFANKYVMVGSQFSPAVLRVGDSATAAPYDSTQIASQLNNASSTFALSIDAAANRLISAICKIDGGAPTIVCSQSFAQTLSYVRGSPPNGSLLMASEPTPASGLRLDLNLSVNADGSLTTTVEEFNTKATVNDIAAANRWTISPSVFRQCGYSIIPVAFVLFRGNYDMSNYTSATAFTLYDTSYAAACTTGPNPTSYSFAALSNQASAFIVSSHSSYYAGNMSISMTSSGYWSGGWWLPTPSAFNRFSPGTYTVAAVDEWGQVAILHFVVRSG